MVWSVSFLLSLIGTANANIGNTLASLCQKSAVGLITMHHAMFSNVSFSHLSSFIKWYHVLPLCKHFFIRKTFTMAPDANKIALKPTHAHSWHMLPLFSNSAWIERWLWFQARNVFSIEIMIVSAFAKKADYASECE